ncbi:hypothetical protein KQS06HV_91373 [Klebsiella quasipneumoniae subsp. similipneumoniae]|nr:hypothetical protein KQS06HV_91373 [Klebsiella quasipneumoniae subsp. similipneumoniae]DAO08149.1 MAG TPA: hypothetical protein [Caudoviricetes sp.]
MRSLFSTLPLSRRTFPLYDAFKLVRANCGGKTTQGQGKVPRLYAETRTMMMAIPQRRRYT